MTLVRILKERSYMETKYTFENVESAIEDDKGVHIHFEEDTERFGREKFFTGFRIVAVGR